MDLYSANPNGWSKVDPTMGSFDIENIPLITQLCNFEDVKAITLIGVGTARTEFKFIEGVLPLLPHTPLVTINDISTEFAVKAFVEFMDQFKISANLHYGKIQGIGQTVPGSYIYTMFGNLFGSCEDDIDLIMGIGAKPKDQLILTFPIRVVEEPEQDPLLYEADLFEYEQWARESFGDGPISYRLVPTKIPGSYCVGLYCGDYLAFRFRRYDLTGLRVFLKKLGWEPRYILQYGPKCQRAVAILERK